MYLRHYSLFLVNSILLYIFLLIHILLNLLQVVSIKKLKIKKHKIILTKNKYQIYCCILDSKIMKKKKNGFETDFLDFIIGLFYTLQL